MTPNPIPARSRPAFETETRSPAPAVPADRAELAAGDEGEGPFGLVRLLPEEDAGAFAALRAGWAARLRPEGAAEAAAVERMVAAIWREGRLLAVEDRLLRALALGRPSEGLPGLATLLRYRARLERDRRNAEEELAQLRALARESLAQRDASDAAHRPAPSAAEASGGRAGMAERAGAPRAAGGPVEPERPAARPVAPRSPATAAAVPPGRGQGGPDVGPLAFDREFARLLLEAERELARAAGGRLAVVDPFAGLAGPVPGRDLRTSASALAIEACVRAA